jgi:hypothetical protein
MTCSPASRRSWRPLGQQARWSRTRGGRGYEIDAVGLFLGQLLSHSGPGRDLGDVAQLSRNAPADLTDSRAGLARRRRRTDATSGEDYFAGECWNARREVGHQTGTRLWPERAGCRRELRTAEQQTLASLRGLTWQNRGYGQGLAVSAARRSFTFTRGSPVRGTGGITSFTNATGSNLADLGRVRRVPLIVTRRELPVRVVHRVPAGHGEGLRGTRGEAAGTQPDSSSAERTSDAGVALARTELRLR